MFSRLSWHGSWYQPRLHAGVYFNQLSNLLLCIAKECLTIDGHLGCWQRCEFSLKLNVYWHTKHFHSLRTLLAMHWQMPRLQPPSMTRLEGIDGGTGSKFFTQKRWHTVEPRFNEVAGDRPNLFVKSRVRYIENLDITNLRANDQNVRYIEVIVNDWFVTQMTSVTQFNAIFVT